MLYYADKDLFLNLSGDLPAGFQPGVRGVGHPVFVPHLPALPRGAPPPPSLVHHGDYQVEHLLI